MPFDLTIPRSNHGPLVFPMGAGDILYVLGANGTGKSSLMQNLYAAHRNTARRILAHRQTWLDSGASNLTAMQRKEHVVNMRNRDATPQSRWNDPYAATRTNIAIFDLIDAQNVRARAMADAIDEDNVALAQRLAKADAPIKALNRLLAQSNIPIEIFIEDQDEVMASKNGGARYSISELSDGERNALLIASDVLTSSEGSILLIDEPERHLHRSIISPLLSLLFLHRADCTFVVSTHEVSLPLDNPSSRTLLLRACTYQNSTATAWEADLVPSAMGVDDITKRDILGGRSRLLFVEGTETSLDKPMYNLLFPQASIVPKFGCRDVEIAVSGIRDANDLHWVQAFGIVDNDRRTPGDIQTLLARGIYAVSVYAIEAVYYHTRPMRLLAEKQQELTGQDADGAIVAAAAGAITAIRPHIARLSERVVEKAIRQELMSRLPKRGDIAAAQAFQVTIDVPEIRDSEIVRLTALCDAGNLADIISRYPVRETPALDRIATLLGFQGRTQYESAVLKLVTDEADIRNDLRALFGSLFTDLNAA